jgi:cell wall-associated NlpC family hydrolase
VASSRVHRIRRGTVVAVFAAAAIVLLPGAVAHADPSVAEIEAQINQVWNEAEPLIEKYNAVHEDYQKNQVKQAQLLATIQPLQVQVDLAQARIGAMAAQLYMGGHIDALNVILSSTSPGQLAAQLGYVDQVARDQQSQVQGASDLKAQYDAQKAPIDALVADLGKQDADLKAQRTAIETKLNDLQQLRIKAYGAGGGGTGSFRPWACPSQYLPTAGYKAANFACQQAGKPYVWAAAGPGSYDCSGLTLAAWKQVGVYLPHNAAEQRHSMPSVSRADLRIGDLVFYYATLHHVAIYVGDGKVMSAPTFGDHVRMVTMDSYPINSYGRPG